MNGEVWVSSQSQNLTAFAMNASGNVAPLREIAGNLTGITSPLRGVAVDPATHDVVSQKPGSQNGLITVWAEVSTSTSSPVRTIEIAPTGFSFGSPLGGVAVDPVNDELCVTNTSSFQSPGLFVYARTATGLNPAPLRTLISSDLQAANQIGVDSTTNVVAVTAYSSSVGGALFVYPRTWSGTTVPTLARVGGLAGTWGVALCLIPRRAARRPCAPQGSSGRRAPPAVPCERRRYPNKTPAKRRLAPLRRKPRSL